MPEAAVPHIVATSRIRGIDEDLWFGNFSDEEAERKAAESVAAMVGRIVGAKPFPIAAQRLAEATRDPDCDLNDIIRILERDVALSTRLLRLVNSASFALRTPCTSVRHATSLVGTDRLNQLATTAAILDMVDSSSAQRRGTRGARWRFSSVRSSERGSWPGSSPSCIATRSARGS
jgi:hypothetical protein